MGKLDGKVAVITGTSGGIGKAISLRFAEEGASLALCARTESKLQETSRLCGQRGASVLAMRCDVSKLEDMKAFVTATAKRFGGIDVLVNGAVDVPKPPMPFLEIDEDRIQRCWSSGFLSTWRMTKLCFPYLKVNGGRIINFGSAAGTEGYPLHAEYGAVKEAIRALSRTTANELGPFGINVNVINPWAITDNMLDQFKASGIADYRQVIPPAPPVGRHGDPYEDISPVAVFLACDDSKFITGQTIEVMGGALTHA